MIRSFLHQIFDKVRSASSSRHGEEEAYYKKMRERSLLKVQDKVQPVDMHCFDEAFHTVLSTSNKTLSENDNVVAYIATATLYQYLKADKKQARSRVESIEGREMRIAKIYQEAKDDSWESRSGESFDGEKTIEKLGGTTEGEDLDAEAFFSSQVREAMEKMNDKCKTIFKKRYFLYESSLTENDKKNGHTASAKNVVDSLWEEGVDVSRQKDRTCIDQLEEMLLANPHTRPSIRRIIKENQQKKKKQHGQ